MVFKTQFLMPPYSSPRITLLMKSFERLNTKVWVTINKLQWLSYTQEEKQYMIHLFKESCIREIFIRQGNLTNEQAKELYISDKRFRYKISKDKLYNDIFCTIFDLSDYK